MLQEFEQDMAETDEALSDIRVRVLAGKRKRGEELAHQHVRHSLWKQGSLEAYIELLFSRARLSMMRQGGCQMGVTPASHSCSEAGLEWGTGSLPMGGVGEEVPQGGEAEGADGEQTGKRKRGDEPAHQPVRHWRPTPSCCLAAWMGRWQHCSRGRLHMMRQEGSLMGVAPVGAAQTVTLAVWQS